MFDPSPLQILAGEMIELKIGLLFGFSTMAAAALGNLVRPGQLFGIVFKNLVLFVCCSFASRHPLDYEESAGLGQMTHALMRKHYSYRPGHRWGLPLSCQVHGGDPRHACSTSSRLILRF